MVTKINDKKSFKVTLIDLLYLVFMIYESGEIEQYQNIEWNMIIE